jgi:hypothetical protein
MTGRRALVSARAMGRIIASIVVASLAAGGCHKESRDEWWRETCQPLQIEWARTVQGLSRECTTTGVCTLPGSGYPVAATGYFCGIDGCYEHPVNAEAYRASSAAAALQTQWNSDGCDYQLPCDEDVCWSPPTCRNRLACVTGECQIICDQLDGGPDDVAQQDGLPADASTD